MFLYENEVYKTVLFHSNLLSLGVRIKFNTMDKNSKRLEALLYHAKPTPGKIQVVPTKKHATQRDLSLAYSPHQP